MSANHNRRFKEFFDRYFHIPLAIVTKHELGLPFSPRKPSHKILYKFVHNLFSYRGHRQTHKTTPVKTYTSLSRGEQKAVIHRTAVPNSTPPPPQNAAHKFLTTWV